MKHSDFNRLVGKTMGDCKCLLTTKGLEYASSSNKFHNFDEAAAQTHTTREGALLGMEIKHRISVVDMIEDTSSLSKEAFAQKWPISKVDAKIHDSINYLILLKGMIYDRLAEESKEVN